MKTKFKIITISLLCLNISGCEYIDNILHPDDDEEVIVDDKFRDAAQQLGLSDAIITRLCTATALYLVHYYIGGSLGGFLLLYFWQLFGWNGVIAGGSIFYIAIFAWVYQLKQLQVSTSKLAEA